MPTVKVSDIDMYYEIHGEGDALVLIIGYGGNCGEWFRQIPGLSQNYRVVAFDNRGAGRSDKPDVPYSMQMFAQDIAGLLDTLAIDAAHIYGVSMGGMIAQEFAIRYPEKVISLILGCTLCGGRNAIAPDAEAMEFLFDIERAKRLTAEEITREMLQFIYTQEFIDNNPDIIEQFIANRVEHFPPLYCFMRQAEAIMSHDIYERLPQIKVPTLVIAGTADRLIPVDNSRILASTIPDAELVIMKNTGHGFFIEAAEDANEAILDFLRRHPRPS